MRINTQYFLTVTFLSSILSFAQKSDTINQLDSLDLKNWKTIKIEHQRYWLVIDDVITGGNGVEKIPKNTYLCSATAYEDFEFSCLFRISGDHNTGLINSGIQYRSTIEDDKIIGYQADIGKGYWGDIYDEHRRGKLASGNVEALHGLIDEDGWNSYLIRCIGNKHELFINDIKTAEYYEMNPKIPSKGVIGVQLHSGGNVKIEFRQIKIKTL